MSRLAPRFLAVLVALATGCAGTQQPQRPKPPPTAAPDGRPALRVLFIGNSYTYFNNLPAVFEAFARALAPDTVLETQAVLRGGASLQGHWVRGPAVERIREGGWSHVVLQEQSLLGGLRVNGKAFIARPEQQFFPAAGQFVRVISEVGARPLFFMTWSRKDNLPAQSYLSLAYTRAAQAMDGGLAPAGVAWERVRRERPELELYVPDGHHPGPAGTYLAACVLFATVFQRPCTGAPLAVTGPPWTDNGFDTAKPATLVALPEDVARYLQAVGSEVALARSLPESMVTLQLPLRPRLPEEGEPLRPEGIAGPWHGTLALYPVEALQTPAALELSFQPRGSALAARVRISFPQGDPIEAEVAPELQGDVLGFTVPDRARLESTLQFRARLQGGTLHGVAEAVDANGGHWLGSWTAVPGERPPPAPVPALPPVAP